MNMLRAAALVLLVFITACGSSNPPPTAAPTTRSAETPAASASGNARLGGVDVEPAIRPSRYDGPNPQSWWCVQPSCTPDFNIAGHGPMPTVDLELQNARILGASAVRVEFPWPLIETSRGTFDWSRADAIMQSSKAAGVPLIPILTWTPRWAGGGTGLNTPPSDDSDWTSFVTAVMRRYAPALTRGVDIWNEPDDVNYFAGNAGAYVGEILNPAYLAIKAVSSNTQVIMAGSANDAGGCCPWVNAVLSAGGKFDVAAFHDYVGTTSVVANAVARILIAHGRGGVPIWVTEYSVDSSKSDQVQTLQSVFMSQNPIQMAIWYNLRDTNSYSCCPPALVVRAHWGLLNADFSPKASFSTMQHYLAGSGTPAARAISAVP